MQANEEPPTKRMRAPRRAAKSFVAEQLLLDGVPTPLSADVSIAFADLPGGGVYPVVYVGGEPFRGNVAFRLGFVRPSELLADGRP